MERFVTVEADKNGLMKTKEANPVTQGILSSVAGATYLFGRV